MSQHALLSASSSHKWLHCPPSARLEEQLPDKGNIHTAEGTLAHKIAELKLRKHFTPMGPRTYNKVLKELQADPLYQSEMLGHTDAYLEYVQQMCHAYAAPPHVAIERQLDYSEYAPEGFGTADCIVIGGGLLHVIDFKYGQGVPVEAEGNTQMMLYGLGALSAYSMLYDVERVRMTIMQPRLAAVPEAELSVKELRAWGDSIRPTAQLAHMGAGDFCKGDWCDKAFCKARAQCRTYNAENTQIVTALEAFGGAKPPLISNEEVADILRRAQPIAVWIACLEEYAEKALLQGEVIPGFKLVEGRTSRIWRDGVDKAFEELINRGIEEALLWERKAVTPPGLEKALGKKLFKEAAENLVETKPGKPTFVPETDKREAITLNPTAAEVFGQPA